MRRLKRSKSGRKIAAICCRHTKGSVVDMVGVDIIMALCYNRPDRVLAVAFAVEPDALLEFAGF